MPKLPTPFHRHPISDEGAEHLAGILRALADPSRLHILGVLYRRPDLTGIGVRAAIGERLSQPTVSHHLAILRGAGLVTAETDGRVKKFRIATAGVWVVREALEL